MTGRRLRAGPVGTGLLLLAVATACSSDPAATPATTTSPAPGGVGAEDGPAVEVGPPSTLLLPGRAWPAEVALTGLAPPAPPGEGQEGDDTAPPPPFAQTVYADPDAADPLDGPVLVVGRGGHRQDEAALPGSGLPPEAGGPPDVEIRGTTGYVREDAGRVLVAWEIDQSPGCTAAECGRRAGFVLGLGVDREAVLAAAEGATVDPGPPALAPVPAGFAPLGTLDHTGGTLHLPDGSGPQVLHVEVAGVPVALEVWDADPRLVPHLQVWAGDGSGRDGGDVLRATARDDGLVVVARRGPRAQRGPDLDAVDAAVAALVPGTEAEATALRHELAASVPLTVADDSCLLPATTGDVVQVAGSIDVTRWAARLGWDAGTGPGSTGPWWDLCVATDAADGVPAGWTDSRGTRLEATGPDQLALSAVTSSPVEGTVLVVVGGHVPEATATVEVAVAGLVPVTVAPEAVGPPGHRWFAAAAEVDADALGPRPPVAVTARGPDGAVLARGEDG